MYFVLSEVDAPQDGQQCKPNEKKTYPNRNIMSMFSIINVVLCLKW